jgi:hypothetical protein
MYLQVALDVSHDAPVLCAVSHDVPHALQVALATMVSHPS